MVLDAPEEKHEDEEFHDPDAVPEAGVNYVYDVYQNRLIGLINLLQAMVCYGYILKVMLRICYGHIIACSRPFFFNSHLRIFLFSYYQKIMIIKRH